MTIWLADPLVQEILVGVVGNGLWSLAAQSGLKTLKGVKSLASPPRPESLAAIRAALDQLEKSLESKSDRKQARLVSYLRSPEVESIVRQVFATSLVRSAESSTIEKVRAEFLSSMSQYLDVDERRLEPFACAVFNGILESAGAALDAMISKGALPAHEAMDAARHQMLLDEISNLRANFALIASKRTLDLPAILEFEEKYRQQVGSVHAFIKPPNLESGRRVPIDEIFVAPGISEIAHERTKDAEALGLPCFLSGLYRAVLLGNPGGGKSTVSAKICHDLATRYSDRLFAGREVTPVLVILREFGSQKKSSGCSIAKFIEQQATTRYQLDPVQDAFQYLLLNGRLLVIFDGLDELLDTSYRREITSNVEAFCKLYPSVPTLVTSREVGYEQAPLDEGIFKLFRLAPFSGEQVREYAAKWFARDEDFTEEQRAQKAKAFFSDSSLVPDLRSNPLMLGLMCNLYRAEGYIPRNRPEVYSKCSMMLFEKWDKGRDILVPLPFEEHLRPAMEDLAFWIYSNEDLQGGVTESKLVEKASEYLNRWVFDDCQKARQAACEFIQFCTGRAWVFTDTGTTGDGERLFQFTHRTFLEYFTACHLVSIHPTPEPLADFLKGRIARREWDVVAQLAFQIQSKRVQGAADKLLDLLLEVPVAGPLEEWNTLSFAERSLEFLVPSPRVRRGIAQAAIAVWSSVPTRQRHEGSGAPPDARSEAPEHISNLLAAAAENRGTMAEELGSYLRRALASSDIEEAALAAELGLSLLHPSHFSPHQFSEDAVAFWAEFGARFVEDGKGRIREVARFDRTVASKCCWDGLMTVSEAVAIFGIPFLVIPARSAAFNSWYFPHGFALAGSNLGAPWSIGESDKARAENARQLESMAGVFLTTPTPWIQRPELAEHPFGNWLLDYTGQTGGNRAESIATSPAASFAIMSLIAFEIESRALDEKGAGVAALNRASIIPKDMRVALFGRLDGELVQASISALDGFSFDETQKALLTSWIRREINFIAPSSG